MDSKAPVLILGSASPRRSDLLRAAGLEFQILPADVDESFDPKLGAVAAAQELAERKAIEVSRLACDSLLGQPFWVLGGDTLVVLGEDSDTENLSYLGKPEDEIHAKAMLASLSGTTHRVVTGVAVLRQSSAGELEQVVSAAETTFVTMRAITQAEQDAYVASGEWRGKAGGYAIQESADRFVDQLAGGGFDNVVGLPVGLARKLLKQAGFSA